MADELGGQINANAVEVEIAEVKEEIKKVTARLEELSRERRAGLVVDNERLDREEEYLRKKALHLRKEEEDLRKEKEDLRALQRGANVPSFHLLIYNSEIFKPQRV